MLHFFTDLYVNLNPAAMFLLKVLMTHCLLATINSLPIGDLCIFGILFGFRRTFKFSGTYIEKYCFISLTAELLKMLLL